MGWLNRVLGRGAGPAGRTDAGGRGDGPAMSIDRPAVRAHVEAFVATRRGVEAYVEPPTNVSATTVVFIAHDGEWTRRAVPSRDEGFELAHAVGIPVYDVNQTGYPARMREWSSRQRRTRRAPRHG